MFIAVDVLLMKDSRSQQVASLESEAFDLNQEEISVQRTTMAVTMIRWMYWVAEVEVVNSSPPSMEGFVAWPA